MATFPALTPATRTYTPGDYPYSPMRTLSGATRPVLHSSAMLASTLRLTFLQISEAQWLSIYSHYQVQQGEFIPFPIPPEITSGFTAADFTLANYQWRYVSPPEVEDHCGPYHDVTVELESVLNEITLVQGLARRLLVLLAPGAPSANSTAPAAATTMTIGLSGGGPTGAALTITASLAAGAASGGSVAAPGASGVLSLTLTAGAATGS